MKSEFINNKILITGSTGNIGRPLVTLLANKGQWIKAATRTPAQYPNISKVEAVEFDFDNMASYSNALNNTTNLVIMPRGLDPHPDTTGIPLIDMAIKYGIKHIVLISGIGVENLTEYGYRVLENHLINSGVGYTILRASWFMSLFFRGFINRQQTNIISLPINNTALIAFIDPLDVAIIIAESLTDPQHKRKIYQLTGAQSLTLPDCVHTLSDVTKNKIHYKAITEYEMQQHYIDLGTMSMPQIIYMLKIFSEVNKGSYAKATTCFTDITERNSTDLRAYFEKHQEIKKGKR